MFNEINEKTIYNIIVGIYLIIGILYTFIDKYVPQQFTILIVFFMLKMIFNYKKCTISYLECKLRHVKREDGYLSSFIDHIVDLRNFKYKNIMYLIGLAIIMHTPPVKSILKL